MNEEKNWDDKTQTLVASLEALLQLHREQRVQRPRGPVDDAPEAVPAPEPAPRP